VGLAFPPEGGTTVLVPVTIEYGVRSFDFEDDIPFTK
jgi:hypothetical protein